MLLLFTSFLAGILTVFAPCVLILLPVIVGSSLATDADQKADRRKPYIISFSLGISVLAFTLLLKASTVLIGVDPQFWKSLSGGIVVILGISLLFPLLWASVMAKIGFENSSNKLLNRASKKSGVMGYVLTGAALGPVFSACSPVYALILATVLPVNLALGMVYMTLYATGLSLALLAIALTGRRLTKHLNWVSSPDGGFRKVLAILLIVIGLSVFTGFDKKVQTWILEHAPFSTSNLEKKLVPKAQSLQVKQIKSIPSVFNVEKPYQAPEIAGVNTWINSAPLTIASLKGKVVLVDFWTYSCINCIRTQPYLNSWQAKYASKGLVIIGVHAPEFAFEKVAKNVRGAVKDAKILYPVALDNSFSTWNAYNNQYWPAKYLIDKNGKIRMTHFGEGNYAETETAIQALLKESGASITQKITQDQSSAISDIPTTPETYLNYSRGERFANEFQIKKDASFKYILERDLPLDIWSLGGSWKLGEESTLSTGDGAQLSIRFSGRNLYLVMSGPDGTSVSATINGSPLTSTNGGGNDVAENGAIRINGPRLYKIVSFPTFQSGRVLTLTVPTGVTVNAFTFGG